MEKAMATLFEKKAKEIGLERILSATFDTKNDIGYLFNQLTNYLTDGKGISGHRKGISDQRDTGAAAEKVSTNGERSEVGERVRGTHEESESSNTDNDGGRVSGLVGTSSSTPMGEGSATPSERAERLQDLFGQVADMGLDGGLGNKEYTRLMVDIYKELPEDVRTSLADDALPDR